MIQSMGDCTFLGAFEIVVRVENNLIQARKLPPRPPMPYFIEVQQPILAMVTPLVVVPPATTLLAFNIQVVVEENVVIAPIRKLKE